MATKTIITYNGVKYQEIELEEIGNTGHYKAINRTVESILGELDDKEKLEQAITNINDFRIKNGTVYILTDSLVTGLNAKYYYLFTSIAVHYPKDYNSLADGVLDIIQTLGYVNKISYNPNEIVFNLTTKTDEQELILYLRPISNDIKVIGA